MPGLNTRVAYVTASFAAAEPPKDDAIHLRFRDVITLRREETIITTTITNRDRAGHTWTYTGRVVVGARTGGHWHGGRSIRDDDSMAPAHDG